MAYFRCAIARVVYTQLLEMIAAQYRVTYKNAQMNPF